MVRVLLSALLGAGLLVVVGNAQEPKKEKAKAPPRIAIDDPKKAAEDPDFAVQGEYVGMAGAGKKDSRPVGAQVVALGNGKFDVKWYQGGLPGTGWDGKPAESLKGERKDGKVMLSTTEQDGKTVEIGLIENEKLALVIVAEAKKTTRESPTLGAKPPEGAVVLFGGPDDVSKWERGKIAELSDGRFLSVSGTRSILTKLALGSFKAHLEFRLAWMPNSRGQGRSNSGVYLQNRYEIQVLDSFGLKGENNECGGIYTQHKPLVNMCLPPMQWQTYDIDFTAAAFDADGKKTKNARLTVVHNGVKIHDNVELPKECPGGAKEGAAPGPFQIQDHGDPVVYRNFWVAEKK